MCGKHQCPIAQLVPPGFPSPGKFFAHPVTLLGLPGERNIRNITCWLWGVVAQCGSQGAGGAGHSIARQHKELSALLFLEKKGRKKSLPLPWERRVLAPAPEKFSQLRDVESQNILSWK